MLRRLEPYILIAIVSCFVSFTDEFSSDWGDPRNRLSSGESFFYRGKTLLENNKLDSAYVYLTKSRNIFLNANNLKSAINSIYYLGEIQSRKNNVAAAISFFQSADKYIIRMKGLHPLRADVELMLSNQYFKKNDFVQAYKIIEGCLKQSASIKISDSTLAKLYYRKGTLEYYKGDYTQAAESYQKSRSIGEIAFGKKSLFVSDQVNNLGVIFFMIGRYDEALAYYRESELIMTRGRISSPVALAGTYSNIGLIFKSKNDMANAVLFFNKAYSLVSAHPQHAESTLASSCINLAFVYQMLGNREKQYDFLKKSMLYVDKVDPVLALKIYMQLAFYYTDIKDYSSAEKQYGLSIRRAQKLLKGSPELAYQYFNYGEFKDECQKPTEALTLFNKALPLFMETFGEHHPSTANCYLEIARSFAKTGNTDLALQNVQKALISVCTEFSSMDYSKNPEARMALSETGLVRILKFKADLSNEIAGKESIISKRITLYNRAWQTYLQTLNEIDKIRIGYNTDDSRVFLSDNEHETYSTALKCVYNLYHLTHQEQYLQQAFMIADNAHASSLQSVLKEKELTEHSRFTDTLFIRDQKLRKDISMYQGLVQKENSSKRPNKGRIGFWNEKIANLTLQVEQLSAILKKRNPTWYQYRYGLNNSGGLRHLQSYIDKNEALVEYYLTDSDIYSFCLTNKSLRCRKQPIPDNFETSIQNVLTFVKQPRIYRGDSTYCLNYRSAAWKLYKLLLYCDEDMIRGKHLIVIPSGELSYISFETLLTSPTLTKKYSFKDLPYLIREHAVRYSFAANMLQYTSDARKLPGGMVAFAPDYKVSTNKYLKNANTERGALESLTETSEEVASIAKYFPGKLFRAERASEENFKKYASRYGTIHLAMHALVNDQDPLQSRLAFTAGASSNEDDFLYAGEIYNLNLNAGLVVLSACNTGVGKLSKGEGMMSLTRGFAFAGVPSIVMTLWPVSDASSANLVAGFYRHLSANLNKDNALQQAKIDFINKSDIIHAHPYFWAGYVLIGDNQPIKKDVPFYVFYIGMAVLFLLFGVIWIFRKKSANS
ncbi:MAG: CHAT domain-containing protein [Bacteroidota bacterium]|nr:CHAT domain-containing protein [Bacteroidota bacterium]